MQVVTIVGPVNLSSKEKKARNSIGMPFVGQITELQVSSLTISPEAMWVDV
jgi:hypothetical protein